MNVNLQRASQIDKLTGLCEADSRDLPNVCLRKIVNMQYNKVIPTVQSATDKTTITEK